MGKLKNKKVVDIEYNYIAMDSTLHVFAGYKNGYPFWDMNVELAKEITGEIHLKTLQRWFPNKIIELIRVKQ